MNKLSMRINKIKIELFDIIEQQELFRVQYRRLEGIKRDKLQELRAARAQKGQQEGSKRR